jgi:cellulose biosynthesis protein BcsQ
LAKVISLFNHKGGVSKTTTTFNLGWMLARKDQRVLLVDCDPQCNLTGMVLGFEHLDNSSSIEGTREGYPLNIREALAPAFESRPSLIKPVKCANVRGNDRLFLLPGHIGLAEYEVTLGIAQELSGSLVTLRNLPGSLRYLIDITAKSLEIDTVLIDMSPSLGAINQNLFTTSEFFLVPMHPDYFAVMAIDSLASVLPKWKGWSEAAKSLPILREAEYPFPSVSPMFLGYVIQKYRPRSGVPSAAFQEWIDQIEKSVADRLLPALRQGGMVLPDQVYRMAGFEPYQPLLQMADFNSLIARSQEHQAPIFELTDAQLGQAGVVLENTKDSMDRFRGLFSEAADRVLTIVRHARST